ncbi:MAG: cell wall metabolism sensor histidine kinase WalK [bacterium]|nr:cell wall metabolism sensor histidine kinase WalK [bacterium]
MRIRDSARSRNLGGTGLGSAVVKQITHAQNGFVTVNSKIGRGSTFTIHLPIKSAEALSLWRFLYYLKNKTSHRNVKQNRNTKYWNC